MSRRKLTGKSEAIEPQSAISARVQVVFTADDAQIAAIVVTGEIPIPPEGQAALINIPVDARQFLADLTAKIATFEQEARERAVREKRIIAPKPKPIRLLSASEG